MGDYLHFFSEEEAGRIVTSIEQAERSTSGEIRVHIEDRCKHNPTARAVQVFERLGMCETREKNGVLFYVSSKDHDFAVIGDSGIHERVGDSYWNAMRDELESEFRKGEFTQGLCDAILKAGEALSTHFPRKSDDRNELDNTISSQRN